MEWLQVIRQEFDSWCSSKDKIGFDQIFLSAQNRQMRGLNVFERNIDSLEISDQVTVGVLVSRGSYWGASLCDGFAPEALKQTLEAALVASRYADPEPDFSLATPQGVQGIKSHDAATVCLSMKQLEKIALEIEEKAYAYSPKIFNVPHAACGYDITESLLLNSNGVCVHEGHTLFKASLSCAAKGRTDRIVNVGEMLPVNRFGDFDLGYLVNLVGQETIRRLDPGKITSGTYPVLFDPQMAAHLLSQFVSVFSGDMVYKHMSKFEGKKGQKVASNLVSLRDSSTSGLIPHVYDAEGELCQELYLINQGVLQDFLQNRYTATKLNETSNGHADGGFGGLPGVSPTNLSWDGCLTPDEDLIKQVKQGVYISEMAGASVSPVSGDFSYGAQGYRIENGQITSPLADFTVAGNFFDLLQKIAGLGSNLTYFSPGRLGSYGGRLLLVEALEIAG